MQFPVKLRVMGGAFCLTGLDPVLAEFRGVGGMPDGFHRSRPRRPALLRTLLSVKVAGAVAAAVLGGSVAAAYAGQSLAFRMQRFERGKQRRAMRTSLGPHLRSLGSSRRRFIFQHDDHRALFFWAATC